MKTVLSKNFCRVRSINLKTILSKRIRSDKHFYFSTHPLSIDNYVLHTADKALSSWPLLQIREPIQVEHGATEVRSGETSVARVGSLVDVDGVDGLLLIGCQYQMRCIDGHKHLQAKLRMSSVAEICGGETGVARIDMDGSTPFWLPVPGVCGDEYRFDRVTMFTKISYITILVYIKVNQTLISNR